jgi:hypothetical protein
MLKKLTKLIQSTYKKNSFSIRNNKFIIDHCINKINQEAESTVNAIQSIPITQEHVNYYEAVENKQSEKELDILWDILTGMHYAQAANKLAQSIFKLRIVPLLLMNDKSYIKYTIYIGTMKNVLSTITKQHIDQLYELYKEQLLQDKIIAESAGTTIIRPKTIIEG